MNDIAVSADYKDLYERINAVDEAIRAAYQRLLDNPHTNKDEQRVIIAELMGIRHELEAKYKQVA